MLKLPDKALLRVDEVAAYFDVTGQTIRLWIDHGRLVAERYVEQSRGTLRVTRESVIALREKSKVEAGK
jgi:predicted transcriptional regulator